ncbi:MerR family transcriptional regulator [Streptomyces tendae]|uniref:hypothetical protein n=1 Tax=Streptomyces tendae TaxID=1932 RepID=UPI003716FF88
MEDLAHRTGLKVKTIRFHSDTGIVPPTHRSPAGYRPDDIGALARLDLVPTPRDLGLDPAVLHLVLDREVSVPEVAAAHANALEVQIHALRPRRAVLRAVAKRGTCSAKPERPDAPHLRHVDAWAELAELTQNPDFHAADHRTADYQTAEHAQANVTDSQHDLTASAPRRQDRRGEPPLRSPPAGRSPVRSTSPSSWRTRQPPTSPTTSRPVEESNDSDTH